MFALCQTFSLIRMGEKYLIIFMFKVKPSEADMAVICSDCFNLEPLPVEMDLLLAGTRWPTSSILEEIKNWTNQSRAKH